MKAHQIGHRNLNRPKDQRTALLRSLGRNLIIHGRITTTAAKAKETRRFVERLITRGKEGGLHQRRLAISDLPDPVVIKKVFDVLAPRYANRAGGYTRILHMGQRRGDASDIVLIEFVGQE